MTFMVAGLCRLCVELHPLLGCRESPEGGLVERVMEKLFKAGVDTTKDLLSFSYQTIERDSMICLTFEGRDNIEEKIRETQRIERQIPLKRRII